MTMEPPETVRSSEKERSGKRNAFRILSGICTVAVFKVSWDLFGAIEPPVPPPASWSGSTNNILDRLHQQGDNHDDAEEQSKSNGAIDCASIPSIEPVNIARMRSLNGVPYAVSFSWWDHRITAEGFAEDNDRIASSNDSVDQIQILLSGNGIEAAGGAFVDVGANVGFMTNFALAMNRTVFAIDPISYDIAKLCEGYRENVRRGYYITPTSLEKDFYPHQRYFLYHAAAGPSLVANTTITRPSDEIGKFDQSSLSEGAVFHDDLVEEFIPLITVDSIVPYDTPVHVVKIDVQGHEYGVLLGMTGLLSRSVGYPKHVFYEESPRHIAKAGLYEVGGCQKLLEGRFNYSCRYVTDGDVLCSKG